MTNNLEPSPSKLAETAIYHGAVQKIKELTACIELVRKYPAPQRVMEIGSASGGTFWLWCQLTAQTGHIISLDLPMAMFNNSQRYNKGLLKSYGKPSQLLSFIRKDSHTDKAESIVKKALKPYPLDILFIDGDHTYEGVKEDYVRYSKYVRSGGIIIFHDIIMHDQILECQVHKFWNELKETEETHEFIDFEPDDRGWGTWGGIGIMIKK